MKPKKTKKILLVVTMLIIFIAGILLGSTITQNQANQAKQETTQIIETQVETQTIENTLTSSGEILSSGTEKIALNTSYYFKTMCVEEDDMVAAGEHILEYTNGTYLTASYDCLISSYTVPETNSKCTASHYVEVQNLETVTMNIQINESDIGKVVKGQEVKVELAAIENKTYTGIIKSISQAGTYATSGTTFSGVVEFENDGNVKVGMSATGTIILEKAENCIAIPIQAVQMEQEQKYVVVVKQEGSTQEVNIQTGISNDTYVQVTAGLTGGETIQMTQTVSNDTNRKGGERMNFGEQRKEGSQMQMPEINGQMPNREK